MWGTIFFTLSSDISDRWYAIIDALAMPAPGKPRTIVIGTARKTRDVLADALQAAASGPGLRRRATGP
ncbi:hypothetical protein [Streptomyces sp. NBC_01233]|uniref:hypothetical protein n=1 Tax=Streptomyces sp. NBC_01233 TaxID=2903787 RepID=UPI002E0E57BF|nr:hypothetical protein OG332_36440 [Streptomyces sp. NBC_01233]